jgi:Nitrate and nitrite sensing/Histidine kinase-, DNA gyrase B-, and HSP90-like ATPase
MAQPPQTTRRPAGAAFLAIPLLAVLVLAGVGAITSLREGARAERVRDLVPFVGALTTLVHELQRERSLSVAPPAGQEPGGAGTALETARRAVDDAVTGYRLAAIQIELSGRDRRLDQRLAAGRAELAGLPALRAVVDTPGAGDPGAASAAVSRRYGTIVGNLLGVGADIGLREAGQDGGLLRAVTAASAFARARELADRERLAAARAAAGGRFDPAARAQVATEAGRQDALLAQFDALASPEQRRLYLHAFPVAEVEQATALRRAALEGGSGSTPDLAGWSRTTTARVERMGEVEGGLDNEVARLAGLAERDADRQAAAYGGVFLLTACAATVLLVLAAGRSRRSRDRDATADRPASERPGADRPASERPGADRPRTDRPRTDRSGADRSSADRFGADWGVAEWGALEPHPPVAGPPVREGSPAGLELRGAVHTPLAEGGNSLAGGGAPLAEGGAPGARALPPLPPDPAAGAGLADLARRSQDLVDQQLELLEQVGRDHADPRLPGRLLQVDRLAARARRNAHNLIVLAGGQPSNDHDGPVPLADVAAAAARGNPDAPRVDLAVPEDLLVPGPAADDLANLLAELVDNATAFSAPETRVRVSGQRVGSGHVLEVEDEGLGMTDAELEAVNRRLAGDPAAGDGLGQGLGTWVAGRLAERHDVRVQLRRSSSGGVTALVFFPEPLVVRADPAGRGAPPPAGDGPEDGALASLHLRRYVTQVPEREPPLPKRAPHSSLAPDLAATGDPGRPGDPSGPAAGRSPEQVRSMLTRYRSGLERGRAAAARDLPDDPDDEPAP